GLAAGTYTFTVTNAEGCTSEPSAAAVINDLPEITGQNEISVKEDSSLTITTAHLIIEDSDNTPAEMTVLAGPGNHYTVSGDHTIIPFLNYHGTLTVPLTVNDSLSTSCVYNANIIVNPVNDPPVVSDIPDQSIPEGDGFAAIPLDNFVHDTDNTDNQITWTFSGSSKFSVIINSTTRVATISPKNPEWNGSETITFTATDPGLASDSSAATFTVIPVNDPPVLGGMESSSITYLEGSGQLIITEHITVSDTDNLNLNSASVVISSGYKPAEDQLIYNGGSYITNTWNSTTGVLSLNGPASVQNFRDALRNVRYINLNNNNPSENQRIVTFYVYDSVTVSNPVSRTITVKGLNDEPQLSGIEKFNLDYPEGSGPTAVTATVLASDPDNLNLTGAAVWISAGFIADEDSMSFTDIHGISGSWEPSAGILNLTGISSVANYQSALRNIQYTNTNTGNPNESLRTVSFYIKDSLAISNTVTRKIKITGVNDQPVLSNIETGAIVYHEGDKQTKITNTLKITDPDNEFLSSAVVTISENYIKTEDLLVFTDQHGITGIWNAVSGTMILLGNATITDYQAALRSVAYINNNQINPGALTRKITISVNDGDLSSKTVIRIINVIPVNDPPVAQSVIITGNRIINSVLTGSYTFIDPEGDNEGASLYRWFLSESSSGQKKSIISGASSKQYQVQYNDGGKWIGFTVNPRDINGDTAASGFSSPWYYINAAPVAGNLNVEGLIGLDQTITATFDYTDLENDPENSSEHNYKWYRANDKNGTGKTLIAGTKSYQIVSQDDQKYISFEIIPAASIGSLHGIPVQSSWYGPIVRLPNAVISGSDTVCQGDEAKLSVHLTTGNPPWSFTYTINNQNPETVSGIYETRYILKVLQEGRYKLDSVKDNSRKGTVSGEAFVIFYTSPSAHLSGGGTICEGTTASLRIDLAGNPPYMVKYKNDNSVSGTINNIPSSPGFFKVKTAGKYTLTEVSDKYCKGTVSGSAPVTVLPAPDVDIHGLNTVYSVNSDPIPVYGVPSGGTFDGDGIILKDDTVFFLPSWAGVENSPHKISYYYQSPVNGCMGKDTIMIDILEVHADISFPDNKTIFCYNDPPFEIRGLNLKNVTGNFRISGNTGIIDNGDNTAVINPLELSGGEYKVTYSYFDKTWLEYSEKFRIEYVDPIWFAGFDKNTFCNNDSPLILTGNKEDGIFYGNSVTGNSNTGFRFNPDLVPSGTDTIYFKYTTINGCERKTYEVVNVNPAPVISFHVLDSCISRSKEDSVIFINSTQSTDIIIGWYWDFDDIGSGQANYSNLENPKHLYTKAGTKIVMLSATTDKSCIAFRESRINLGDKPQADFNWNTECYRPDQPVLFSNQSRTGIGILDKFEWQVQLADTLEIFKSDSLSYAFPGSGDYRVGFKVETNFGCTDSIMHDFSLRPVISIADDPYYEDFETGKNGWIKTEDSHAASNSWKFGFSEEDFPGMISGAYCWYTDIIAEKAEHSWIISPCFNFSTSKKPMIRINAWRSFDKLSDGAVMQYTDDNGEHWYNVGAINDGINWYNAYAIEGEPGGQSIGWSNIEDKGWTEMRHSLDSLKS
ncbi:MAG: hypothetical protein JW723_13095, partial [Bacteroidales bacterium]|nr:hypothetical protein [Bacteroidales bacterium]